MLIGLSGLIGLCPLADTSYFLWFSHMPKMATEIPVATTDTEYWHAGCYMEELYAKPINSREQLFVITLKNTANMDKKVNKSLGDIELFDLSIEVKSDVQSCKDDLDVIVHLLVETIASLGANFSVVQANKSNCHFLFPLSLL